MVATDTSRTMARSNLARVISSAELMPGNYLLWLESSQIASKARAGQFVMVKCGEGFDPLLRRPLSIHRVSNPKPLVPKGDSVSGDSSATTTDQFALLARVVGKGTEWLSRRRVGDEIDVLGPFGKTFPIEPTAKNLLLIAGGMGVAPMVALAEEALAGGMAVTMLIGAPTASQVYPRELLPAEVELLVTTDDGTMGRKGLVTDQFEELLHWPDQVMACGPQPMYITMQQIIRQTGTRMPVHVLLEKHMACGVGACLGCVVKTRKGLKRACKDGPVFDLREVEL